MFCVGDILVEDARQLRVVVAAKVRRAVSAGMLRRAARGKDMVSEDVVQKRRERTAEADKRKDQDKMLCTATQSVRTSTLGAVGCWKV
jgi:hypothetical protein